MLTIIISNIKEERDTIYFTKSTFIIIIKNNIIIVKRDIIFK